MPWAFPAGPPMVGDSRRLALRVHVPDAEVTKALIFDALMSVGQTCEQIRHQIREIDELDNPKEYGLFLPHEDNKKGLWLDNSRSLEHYILRNGDKIEYKYRFRCLCIRTLDGTRKTLRVDDSKTLAELMLPICTKMGIYNYEEYLLVRDTDEVEKERTMTMRRSHQSVGLTGTLRDADKMDKLRKELHTDDEVVWLNPAQSLRQQGIHEKEILLLRRRYFFSDMNVDARDPVQLNLLYVQLKDAILNGTHPVTLDEAVTLAALQSQVELGNYSPEKFRAGYLDLKDYLPKEFLRSKGVERKIFQQHATFSGVSDVEARVKYCHFCRSLKTYGITFFLVKEKMKGKNRLIPRLLGITKDSVVRLDERTKEVVKVWPLTSILKWAASPNAFTMDFGEYSPDEYYTAQTAEGEQISQLIAGYIDIILKKQKARDHQGLQGDEESAMYEENVRAERAKIIHNERRSVGPADHEREMIRVNETIERLRQQQQQQNMQQIAAIANGNGVPPTQTHPHFDEDEMNGYISTTERRYIAVESIPTLSSDAVRTRSIDQTDDFMTGGTQYYMCKTMTPAQRALHVTIEDNMTAVEQGKQLLDIGSPSERSLTHLGHDEASRRWLDESIGATEVKVADEMGAMNAAVAQAVRSANRADAAFTMETADPGDDLMMMQQSFRVVTVHFPAFVDDVKRVAVLRRESGILRAEDEPNDDIRYAITKESEVDAQNLLGAARTVADSFTELLKAATPLTTRQIEYGVDSSVSYVTEQQGAAVGGSSRKAILEAANRVGEASNDFLRCVMHEGETVQLEDVSTIDGNIVALTREERMYQDELLGLAKEVANATAVLVVKAKHLATQTNLDPDYQQRVVMSATHTGLCTSQLVACTKVLAPTIQQANCQQQLSESAREVSQAVDSVVRTARTAGQSANESPGLQDYEVQEITTAVCEVDDAATEVRNTLDRLNVHLLHGSARPYQGDTLDLFQQAYDELRQETDGARLVGAARRLSQVTAQMIADVKIQAENVENDPERQTRLFAAAKHLADATTDLINHAKLCSANPDSQKTHVELKRSADDLVVVAYASAAELLNVRVMRSLQAAARSVVSSSNNLVTTSRTAASHSRANNYHVLSDGKDVNHLLPKLVNAIRFIRRDPNDPLAQLELICSCHDIIDPCTQLARSSRSMAPTVDESSLQNALDNSASQMIIAVETLKACLARAAPIARQLQMDGALARLLRLVKESEEMEASAKAGTLAVLPDDKVDDRFQQLKMSVRDGQDATNEVTAVIESLSNVYANPQPLNRDQEEEWLGISSNRLATTLSDLTRATCCCLVVDGANTEETIGASSACLAAKLAYRLVCESRKLTSIEDAVSATPDQHAELIENNRTVVMNSSRIGEELKAVLAECLMKGLPGQRELTEASDLVKRRRKDLVRFEEDPTVFEYQVDDLRCEKTQSEFTGAAVELNQATVDLTSCYTPANFKKSSVRFAGAYDTLVDRGMRLSKTNTPDTTTSRQLLSGLVEVSDRSDAMLDDARQVCSQPESDPLRQRLHNAARSVTDSINQLLSLSTSGVIPGTTECDAALRRLEAARTLLETATYPVNQHPYHVCIDSAAQSIAPLSDGIRGTLNGVKSHNSDVFTANIRQVADSLCHIAEETAQAAYLIGVSHPQSEPSRGGNVEISLFEKLQRDIQNGCKVINSPQITEREVVSLANDMSANMRTLRDACNSIAAHSTNQEAKRQITTMSHDTIRCMSELIQRSADWSDEGRRSTANNSHAVSAQVSQLVRYITSVAPFAGQPAKISPEARESQQPICAAGLACIENGRGVILASKNMLQTAETVGDPANTSFAAFTAASRDLTDNTKRLLILLNSQAPGQIDCQRALLSIRRLLNELERDKMALMDGALPSKHDNTEEGFVKQLSTSVRAVRDLAPQVGQAAVSEPENLGHRVHELDLLLPGLVSSAVGAASRTSATSTQMIYVEHTRTVLESAEQLLHTSKAAGGNAQGTTLHDRVNESVKSQISSCDELLSALDNLSSQQNFITKLMAILSESQALVDQRGRVSHDSHFTDYQSRMLRLARHMEQQTQATVLSARRAEESMGQEMAGLVQNLAQDYAELCMISRDAIETIPAPDQAEKLRWAVKNIGQTTRGLLQAAIGVAAGKPESAPIGGARHITGAASSLRSLDFSAGSMNDRLRELIALLETQGPGTLACLQGASTVSGIIADLDTTILFASSGTLHPPIRDDLDMHQLEERRSHGYFAPLTAGSGSMDDFGREQDNFISIRESIHRAADALVQDTRSLVSGASEDQTRLAGSTHLAVRNISQLADVVKQGAAVLGPGQTDSQVGILRAAKDTAVSVRNTLLNASQAHGRPRKDPVLKDLHSSGEQVEACTARLQTAANAIDTESTRGIKALMATANLSRQLAHRVSGAADASSAPSLNNLGSVSTLLSTTSSLVSRYMAPDELSRASVGPLRAAISKAMLTAASRRQDDAVVCANVSRRAVLDLVHASKNLQRQPEIKEDLRQETAETVRKVMLEVAELMDGVKCVVVEPTEKDRSRVSNSVERITTLSKLLIGLVEKMRDAPRLVMYFRANSPEWRDVAEKYLGRHIAFHHNYTTCFHEGGVGHATSSQISCLHQNLDASGRVLRGSEAATEAERRLENALQLLELDLHKSTQVPSASHAQPILSMTQSVAATTRHFLGAIRSKSPQQDHVNLGRSELAVALATDHLCELARLCSETKPEGPMAAPVDDPVHVMPSRERLLSAVRRVATASAELLYAAQSSSTLAPADVSRIQAAGKAVKQKTDAMATIVLNGGPIFSHLPSQSGFEEGLPVPNSSGGRTGDNSFLESLRIATAQAAVEDLQNQLARVDQPKAEQ